LLARKVEVPIRIFVGSGRSPSQRVDELLELGDDVEEHQADHADAEAEQDGGIDQARKPPSRRMAQHGLRVVHEAA
jgi:hypothetical protein